MILKTNKAKKTAIFLLVCGLAAGAMGMLSRLQPPVGQTQQPSAPENIPAAVSITFDRAAVPAVAGENLLLRATLTPGGLCQRDVAVSLSDPDALQVKTVYFQDDGTSAALWLSVTPLRRTGAEGCRVTVSVGQASGQAVVSVLVPQAGADLQTRLTDTKPQVLVKAPYLYQDYRWPNGCEGVSGLMALRWAGVLISEEDFFKNCMQYAPNPVVGGVGGDPGEAYLGDPSRPDGWGCWDTALAAALGRAADPAQCRVERCSGLEIEELCRRYLDRGIPVILWATVGMAAQKDESWFYYWQTPAGKKIIYCSGQHCLLLVGYNEEFYFFNDPKHLNSDTTLVAYPKATVEKAYQLLNRQSIALCPTDKKENRYDSSTAEKTD